MKMQFAALVFLLSGSFALANPTPVSAPLQKAYVPVGFDSNDVVQFVVEGYFPNSCYRPGFVGATARRDGRTIEVSVSAFRYPGLCLEVIIPFDHVITMGVLAPGRYEIVQAAGGARLGSVDIRAALTDDPDDFMYAPVSQAMLQSRGGGVGEIVLTGEFGLSCLKLDDVLISVHPGPGSIVVQPLAKQDPTQTCTAGVFPFQKAVQVRGPVGRYVLHVRSMNGKAVNSLVDLR